MTSSSQLATVHEAAGAPAGAAEASLGTPEPGAERFAAGEIVAGRFRIVARLGRGGMGEVFRAEDLKLGQTVALKFLPEAREKDEGWLRRLLREVRSARDVAHANVCRVFDVFEAEGRHFIAMEFVDGEDLASLLRRIGRLPEERALRIAGQLCAGLNAIHARGLLHRDLKPANIMLDGEGRVRITDFGLAGAEAGFARGEIREGTPAYMAPEQREGTEVTIRSDVYALGLVLFELFTGEGAFGAQTEEAAARLRLAGAPRQPSSVVGDLDPRIEGAILRCLETDPTLRPATAAEVASLLPGQDLLAATLAAGDTPSPDLLAACGRSDGLAPGWAWSVALVSVAVFFLGLWLYSDVFVLAHAPPTKPPAVVSDRAREMIAALGHDEPWQQRPVDSVVEYLYQGTEVQRVLETGQGEDTLSENPDIWVLAYRQEPRIIQSRASGFGTVAPGPARVFDPYPIRPGATVVLMDDAGRLVGFYRAPNRFDADDTDALTTDWSALFELAGLEESTFEPVTPRYQRFMAPEVRRAWVGPHPADASRTVRLEAGAIDGRIVYASRLDPRDEESLSREVSASHGAGLANNLFIVAITVFFVGGALVARVNLRAGRADRRGAARLAWGVGALTFAFETLRAHALMTPLGWVQLYAILATGLLYSTLAWIWYVALEPHARSVWPRLLVSWSRVVRGRGPVDRDPEIGRSVLAGVALASGVLLMRSAGEAIYEAHFSSRDVVWLHSDLLLRGWRHGLSIVLLRVTNSVLTAFSIGFVLVGVRLVTRSRIVAILAAIAVWPLFAQTFSHEGVRLIYELVITTSIGAAMVAVMIRFGVVAVLVGSALYYIAPLASTMDPGTWYSGAGYATVGLAIGLAVYGAWSSTTPAATRSAVPAPITASSRKI